MRPITIIPNDHEGCRDRRCVDLAPDYGYWYQNGVLAPNLTSAYIAVDRATRGTAACRSPVVSSPSDESSMS